VKKLGRFTNKNIFSSFQNALTFLLWRRIFRKKIVDNIDLSRVAQIIIINISYFVINNAFVLYLTGLHIPWLDSDGSTASMSRDESPSFWGSSNQGNENGKHVFIFFIRKIKDTFNLKNSSRFLEKLIIF